MLLYKTNLKLFYQHSIIFLFMSQLSSKSSSIATQLIKSPLDTARNYRIVATSLKCYHTIPHIIEKFDCHQTKRNNRTYSSGSLILRQPINRLDTEVLLDIYQPNGNRLNIFNISVECCEVLAQKKYSLKFLDNLLKVMYTKLNVAPTCPLKTHFNYTITDFDIDERILPAYIPKTKFKSGIHFFIEGRRAVGVVSNGKISKIK